MVELARPISRRSQAGGMGLCRRCHTIVAALAGLNCDDFSIIALESEAAELISTGEKQYLGILKVTTGVVEVLWLRVKERVPAGTHLITLVAALGINTRRALSARPSLHLNIMIVDSYIGSFSYIFHAHSRPSKQYLPSS